MSASCILRSSTSDDIKIPDFKYFKNRKKKHNPQTMSVSWNDDSFLYPTSFPARMTEELVRTWTPVSYTGWYLMLIFGYLISIKRGDVEMMTPSCILRPSTAIDRGVGFDLGGCLLRTSLSLNTSSQISIFFFTFSHCCCYQHNACPWEQFTKMSFLVFSFHASMVAIRFCYLHIKYFEVVEGSVVLFLMDHFFFV